MAGSLATNLFTSKSASFAFAGETVEELNSLKVMIEDGNLRPIIDRIYPIENATKAHQRLERATPGECYSFP